ncbi:hypothetical protein C7M84_011097 [Penaeus vannamei]|uniref:Uncharacterized protein n=1 Tax=Penaeus vannamei TaxID=6689 RepID=A0A423T2I6_PENVA|nr:hypothetical protein C7M84_011097 [Penaeus vannamei]
MSHLQPTLSLISPSLLSNNLSSSSTSLPILLSSSISLSPYSHLPTSSHPSSSLPLSSPQPLLNTTKAPKLTEPARTSPKIHTLTKCKKARLQFEGLCARITTPSLAPPPALSVMRTHNNLVKLGSGAQKLPGKARRRAVLRPPRWRRFTPDAVTIGHEVVAGAILPARVQGCDSGRSLADWAAVPHLSSSLSPPPPPNLVISLSYAFPRSPPSLSPSCLSSFSFFLIPLLFPFSIFPFCLSHSPFLFLSTSCFSLKLLSHDPSTFIDISLSLPFFPPISFPLPPFFLFLFLFFLHRSALLFTLFPITLPPPPLPLPTLSHSFPSTSPLPLPSFSPLLTHSLSPPLTSFFLSPSCLSFIHIVLSLSFLLLPLPLRSFFLSLISPPVPLFSLFPYAHSSRSFSLSVLSFFLSLPLTLFFLSPSCLSSTHPLLSLSLLSLPRSPHSSSPSSLPPSLILYLVLLPSPFLSLFLLPLHFSPSFLPLSISLPRPSPSPFSLFLSLDLPLSHFSHFFSLRPSPLSISLPLHFSPSLSLDPSPSPFLSLCHRKMETNSIQS